MIKKSIVIFSWLFLLPAYLYAIDNKPSTPDMVGYTQFRDGVSTPIFRIDHDGNLIPRGNRLADVGTDSQTWRTVNASSLNITGGILVVEQSWFDPVPGSSGTLRSVTFTTATFAATTSFIGVELSSQPDYARNVVIYATYTLGSGIATTTFLGAATIYGMTSMGTTSYERIVFSTTTQYGNIAWTNISSVTVGLTSTSLNMDSLPNAVLYLGTSNYFGLTNRITSASDVFSVHERELGGTGGTWEGNVFDNRIDINTTYHTIQFETVPSGTTDYKIRYKAKLSVP